jgi:hypothetical protein
MKKYTLFLGLNDKITKKQEINTLAAYKVLYNYFKGATITEATGFYKHNDGTVIIEKSLKIELLDFENNLDLDQIIRDLKVMFNQETIAVETNNINSFLM